jgi:ferredoxin
MFEASDEFESRANMDSQFIDFEERCANCGRMYCYHKTLNWFGLCLAVCPNLRGFFKFMDVRP